MQGSNAMALCFELQKSNNEQFYFVLKGNKDLVLLRSEQYRSKQSAQQAMASVQVNSADDARYERKLASDNRTYFNLKAANHEIIGTSPMYPSAHARNDSIATLKAEGRSAIIQDKTSAKI